MTQNIQNKILSSKQLQHLKSSLLYSRIEPNQYQKKYQNRYTFIKVAKAEKRKIQHYKQRAKEIHQNVPSVFIEQKSPFYITVYVEKVNTFQIKDLLILPYHKRKAILLAILETVLFLSKLYGFFYITQKMIGYNRYGNIVLWINQNTHQNQRNYPINHGKLSQQIFVADFKSGFIGNSQQMKDLYKIKTIQGLINRLKHNEPIYTSLYVNQTPSKSIFIDKQMPNAPLHEYDLQRPINSHQFIKEDQNIQKTTIHKSQSLGLIQNKRISFSYISNQVQQYGNKQIRKQDINRPLLYSLSSQILMNKRRQSNNESLMLKKGHSMSYSNIPKISFNYNIREYNQQSNISFFKKDKEPVILSSQQQHKKTFLKRCSTNQILHFKQSTQPPKQSLKISFPHTTTDTFIPFSSNGNLTINNALRDSLNVSAQDLKLQRYGQDQRESFYDQKISEQSSRIEAQLQVLFSDEEQETSQQKLDQMDNIISQIQNILL